MNELIQRLIERAELTEEQARAAAGTVIEYLQAHLPEGAARELSAVVGGPGDAGDPDRVKKTTTAALAATTAAVNAVALPGAH